MPPWRHRCSNDVADPHQIGPGMAPQSPEVRPTAAESVPGYPGCCRLAPVARPDSAKGEESSTVKYCCACDSPARTINNKQKGTRSESVVMAPRSARRGVCRHTRVLATRYCPDLRRGFWIGCKRWPGAARRGHTQRAVSICVANGPAPGKSLVAGMWSRVRGRAAWLRLFVVWVNSLCGCSSAGRAPPRRGGGHGFEARYPLGSVISDDGPARGGKPGWLTRLCPAPGPR
jgi:hypothetical protein